jgi:hypothetical protein
MTLSFLNTDHTFISSNSHIFRGLLPDQHTALISNFERGNICYIPVYDDVDTMIPICRDRGDQFGIDMYFKPLNSVK